MDLKETYLIFWIIHPERLQCYGLLMMIKIRFKGIANSNPNEVRELMVTVITWKSKSFIWKLMIYPSER